MGVAVVEMYYDFGSPNAYFAWKALQAVSKRTGYTLDLHPVLIGGIFKLTGNQPPWMAFGNIPQKMSYMKLEIERFIKAHNLTDFKYNSAFPVNTLLPMRVAIAAQKAEVHTTYVAAVFKAIWEDDENIGDAAVLQDVLEAAGLDGAALLAAAQTEEIKDRLKTETQACVDRGVFGLPTLYLGDEMYFGKETVVLIEQAIIASAAKNVSAT